VHEAESFGKMEIVESSKYLKVGGDGFASPLPHITGTISLSQKSGNT
jgi:hypothetical protein